MMMKPFTVKSKMILMRHAHNRNKRKHEMMMKQKRRYMIVKRRSTIKDTISTILMPRVVLHPLKKSVVIPDDLISEILMKLTARSVGRFRCVCKSWLSITTNLYFIRLHIQQNRFKNQSLIVGLKTHRHDVYYYLASAPKSNTDDVGITFRQLHGMKYHSVIGSCDGLLYVSIFYDTYIINPLTGYSICVPCGDGRFLGFYFHRPTSKYRIIQVTNEIKFMTIILAVGEQSWRRLRCRFPCRFPKSYQNSIDLNECLFWLVFKEQSSYCKQPNTIVTFDTKLEVYSLLSLPPSEKLLDLIGNLVNFIGELGLWVMDNDTIDIWILEEYWVKRYSINYFDLIGCSIPLGRLNDLWIGGVSVVVNENELLVDLSKTQYLIRWNFKSGACYCCQRETNCEEICRSFSYIESLVYPDCFLT